MEQSAKELAKKINEGLMELDYQLCQRALRDGVDWRQIVIIDLKAASLVGLMTALGQDENLWAEFSWEVKAPRETAFERLYQRAKTVRKGPAPSNEGAAAQNATQESDRTGLAKRIDALVGDARLDDLTVGAVAYVLGRKTVLWKAVQSAIAHERLS